MTTQALLEALPDRRYRVTGSGRFAVYGEGNTPAEAISAFRRAAQQAKVITVDLADVPELTTVAPTEVSEEIWDAFLDILEQQRREDDAAFAEQGSTA